MPFFLLKGKNENDNEADDCVSFEFPFETKVKTSDILCIIFSYNKLIEMKRGKTYDSQNWTNQKIYENQNVKTKMVKKS